MQQDNFNIYDVVEKCASSAYHYSLKINEFNQSSQAGVIFFNSSPAKNTNFWVKLLLCVSSDLSNRYTIETRVLTDHMWFSDE